MNLIVCSIFDSAAGAFGRPFYVQSTGIAMRSFADEVNRDGADNQMFGHPEDFVMFHLGQFDDSNGRFTLLESPNPLCRAVDVKVSK